MSKSGGSSQKTFFRLLLRIFVLLLVATLFLKVYGFVVKRQTIAKEATLEQQEKVLEEYKEFTGYNELLAIKTLESERPKLKWSKHITQVLEIFKDLQDVDDPESQTIILSDFKISLEEISLNGQVSTLKALYYNSPTGKFKALLDRFQELDFIREMQIKDYNKGSGIYYDFVLTAKVSSDG